MSVSSRESSHIHTARIGDNQYKLWRDDIEEGNEIIIKFEKGKVKSELDKNMEFKYWLAKEIANRVFGKKKSLSKSPRIEPIKLGSKVWSLKRTSEKSLSKTLSSYATTMIHKRGDDGVLRYAVESNLNFESLGTRPGARVTGKVIGKIKEAEKNYNSETAARYVIANEQREKLNIPDSIPCSKSEFRKGIRAKVKHPESFSKRITSPSFSSPFNRLSALAFQRIEKEFSNKDNFDPNATESMLLLEGNELKLVYKNPEIIMKKDLHRDTVTSYRDMLISEYGKEKLQYASHLARIDFNELIELGKPLTPEHVYRLSILLTNLESHDINQLFAKLQEFKKVITSKHGDKYLKDTSFEDFVGKYGKSFTISEIRGLYRALSEKNKSPKLIDFVEWMSSFGDQSQVSSLDSGNVNKLVGVLETTDKERELALTGRKIHHHIQSGYTTAEKKTFKPWVDQQELLQTYPIIQKTKKWKLFHEKLGHVVSKKHLIREHPVKGFQVGALVPAPLSKDGKKRWYKVTGCINNGYGILNYVLKPVGNDRTLPDIKLFRSTAKDVYHLDSRSTVRTDVNSLNSPGYEGISMTDKYEKEFFDKRSIPVWVGYNISAKKKLEKLSDKKLVREDIDPARKQLMNANLELEKLEYSKVAPKDFRSLLRKYDWLLNDILVDPRSVYGEMAGDPENPSRFLDLYESLRERYIEIDFEKYRELKSSKFMSQQNKDALALCEELFSFKWMIDDPKIKKGIHSMIDELRDNVLTTRYRIKQKSHMNKFNKEVFNHLKEIQNDVEKLYRKGSLSEAKALMVTWNKVLNSYAKSIGEDLNSKLPEGITLSGHSLGGGCSQVYTHRFMIKQHRVPLPGKTFNLFIYDAPGINEEDNFESKRFVIGHTDLFNEFDNNFATYSQQERGDLVPLGGEEHLFAASSKDEARKLARAIDFEGVLYSRKLDAKHPTIAESKYAHATQFLNEGAVKGRDFTARHFTTYDEGLFDRGSKMHDLSVKEGKKLSYELRKHWNLTTVSGETFEKIRKSVGFLPAKKHYTKAEARSEKYVDELGVLAVTEKGVISSEYKPKKAKRKLLEGEISLHKVEEISLPKKTEKVEKVQKFEETTKKVITGTVKKTDYVYKKLKGEKLPFVDQYGKASLDILFNSADYILEVIKYSAEDKDIRSLRADVKANNKKIQLSEKYLKELEQRNRQESKEYLENTEMIAILRKNNKKINSEIQKHIKKHIIQKQKVITQTYKKASSITENVGKILEEVEKSGTPLDDIIKVAQKGSFTSSLLIKGGITIKFLKDKIRAEKEILHELKVTYGKWKEAKSKKDVTLAKTYEKKMIKLEKSLKENYEGVVKNLMSTCLTATESVSSFNSVLSTAGIKVGKTTELAFKGSDLTNENLSMIFDVGTFVFDTMKYCSESKEVDALTKEIADVTEKINVLTKKSENLKKEKKTKSETFAKVKKNINNLKHEKAVLEKELNQVVLKRVEKKKDIIEGSFRTSFATSDKVGTVLKKIEETGGPLKEIGNLLSTTAKTGVSVVDMGVALSKLADGAKIEEAIIKELKYLKKKHSQAKKENNAMLEDILEKRMDILLSQLQSNYVKNIQNVLKVVQSVAKTAATVKAIAVTTGVVLGKTTAAIFALTGPIALGVGAAAATLGAGYYTYKNREFIGNKIVDGALTVQVGIGVVQYRNAANGFKWSDERVKINEDKIVFLIDLYADESLRGKSKEIGDRITKLTNEANRQRKTIPNKRKERKIKAKELEKKGRKKQKQSEKVSLSRYASKFTSNINSKEVLEFKSKCRNQYLSSQRKRNSIFRDLAKLSLSPSSDLLLEIKDPKASFDVYFKSLMSWVISPVKPH